MMQGDTIDVFSEDFGELLGAEVGEMVGVEEVVGKKTRVLQVIKIGESVLLLHVADDGVRAIQLFRVKMFVIGMPSRGGYKYQLHGMFPAKGGYLVEICQIGVEKGEIFLGVVGQGGRCVVPIRCFVCHVVVEAPAQAVAQYSAFGARSETFQFAAIDRRVRHLPMIFGEERMVVAIHVDGVVDDSPPIVRLFKALREESEIGDGKNDGLQAFASLAILFQHEIVVLQILRRVCQVERMGNIFRPNGGEGVRTAEEQRLYLVGMVCHPCVFRFVGIGHLSYNIFSYTQGGNDQDEYQRSAK